MQSTPIKHASQAATKPIPPFGRPLRVLFLLTSMPVGGAETLVSNLISRMDPGRFAPELCCLKELGPLGEQVAKRYPSTPGVLAHKYDLRVLPRLIHRMRDYVDAVRAGRFPGPEHSFDP